MSERAYKWGSVVVWWVHRGLPPRIIEYSWESPLSSPPTANRCHCGDNYVVPNQSSFSIVSYSRIQERHSKGRRTVFGYFIDFEVHLFLLVDDGR